MGISSKENTGGLLHLRQPGYQSHLWHRQIANRACVWPAGVKFCQNRLTIPPSTAPHFLLPHKLLGHTYHFPSSGCVLCSVPSVWRLIAVLSWLCYLSSLCSGLALHPSSPLFLHPALSPDQSADCNSLYTIAATFYSFTSCQLFLESWLVLLLAQTSITWCNNWYLQQQPPPPIPSSFLITVWINAFGILILNYFKFLEIYLSDLDLSFHLPAPDTLDYPGQVGEAAWSCFNSPFPSNATFNGFLKLEPWAWKSA